MSDCLTCGKEAYQPEWCGPKYCKGCDQETGECVCPPRRGYPVAVSQGKTPKPELCHCGRKMISRSGDLEATCGECRSKPGSCDCEPLKPAAKADQPTRRLVLTPASEIQPEPVVWAWEDNGSGRIPAGSFGLFAGREGTGKSSFLIRLAAEVTKGELDGAFKGKPRAVIYMAVEDSWKHTIVPRLMAAGADLAKVYRAEVETIEGETVTLSLPYDNRLLEEVIRDHEVALVALDPLMSAISDHLDTHVNRQVRQALDPLARMADRTGCIVGGIAHFNKSTSTDASSLITASGAFKDVARFIFAFAADQEDGSSVITQTKNSLGRGNLPSLAYRIIEATVRTAKGPTKVGRFVLDGPSARTVQDILSDQGGEERDAKTRAEDYLRQALADGPRRTKEVEEEAREAHGITKRTLERARSALKIAAGKSGPDWWISLPGHAGQIADAHAKSAKPANSGSPGAVGGVGGLEPSPDAEVATTSEDSAA